MRSSLGIDDGSFVFCCVARLRAIKNHKALLSAFARVRQQADAHLLLAGDGELRGELEGLARDLKIARQTHFLGERDDVASVLATSDAFVLSSFSEGTPFSLLEAMAAGLPVIATAVGGIPEIVRDGTEGLLVPPGSVDALYGAMARMISGADARVSMARAARQRAIQKFDARVMVQSYLTTYERHGTRTVLKTA
jgi:glycosyltransferase involved in cell wall biosynthesis